MEFIESIPEEEAVAIFHDSLEINFEKKISKKDIEFQAIFNYCFKFLKNRKEGKSNLTEKKKT